MCIGNFGAFSKVSEKNALVHTESAKKFFAHKNGGTRPSRTPPAASDAQASSNRLEHLLA